MACIPWLDGNLRMNLRTMRMFPQICYFLMYLDLFRVPLCQYVSDILWTTPVEHADSLRLFNYLPSGPTPSQTAPSAHLSPALAGIWRMFYASSVLKDAQRVNVPSGLPHSVLETREQGRLLSHSGTV